MKALYVFLLPPMLRFEIFFVEKSDFFKKIKQQISIGIGFHIM